MSDAWTTDRAEERARDGTRRTSTSATLSVWNPDTLLDHQMTPYHLICLSTGDHHELLDVLIQSSERTLLHSKDDDECTALLYAVGNQMCENLDCPRSCGDNMPTYAHLCPLMYQTHVIIASTVAWAC